MTRPLLEAAVTAARGQANENLASRVSQDRLALRSFLACWCAAEKSIARLLLSVDYIVYALTDIATTRTTATTQQIKPYLRGTRFSNRGLVYLKTAGLPRVGKEGAPAFPLNQVIFVLAYVVFDVVGSNFAFGS